jgi:hypothetical protein
MINNVCGINGKYYKARTNTHIKHEKNTNTQKQNTKPTKQKYFGKKQYKKVIQRKG